MLCIKPSNPSIYPPTEGLRARTVPRGKAGLGARPFRALKSLVTVAERPIRVRATLGLNLDDIAGHAVRSVSESSCEFSAQHRLFDTAYGARWDSFGRTCY